MRIDKASVKNCNLCTLEWPQVPNPKYSEQDENETPATIKDENWSGVAGYMVFDDSHEDDIYYWNSVSVCECCIDKLIKGVNLIKNQKLKSVKL